MKAELLRPEPSFADRALESGPIGMTGLATVFVSAVLLIAAPYVATSRRRLLVLIVIAVFIGFAGYATYDWQHVFLNLSMRDSRTVRDDCIQLLERRRELHNRDISTLQLRGAAIPQSFTRLGAKIVHVSESGVRISLLPENGLTGCEWGFLYNPKRGLSVTSSSDETRATWYRDFYEYRVRGE